MFSQGLVNRVGDGKGVISSSKEPLCSFTLILEGKFSSLVVDIQETLYWEKLPKTAHPFCCLVEERFFQFFFFFHLPVH